MGKLDRVKVLLHVAKMLKEVRGEVLNGKTIIYECRTCGFIFEIPEDGLRKAEVLHRFIACPLGHRGVKKIDKFGDLRECMNQKYSELI